MTQGRDVGGPDYRWWKMAWVSIQFEAAVHKICQQRKKDRSKGGTMAFGLNN